VILVDAGVLLASEDSGDANHADSVALLGAGIPLATIDLAVHDVNNVAELRWRDPAAGERLRERIWLIASYGRLVRMDRALGERAAQVVREHRLSGYDAAYVAAANALGVTLASCDQRDLVRPGLAMLPGECLPADLAGAPPDT
jgi:predicted nucleic acid-binding protein